MNIGVWAEFANDATIAGALPELARHGLKLHLALPARRIGDAALAALTREASAHGVAVRAWLLLDKAQGYWIGEANAEEARRAIEALLGWRAAPGGVVLDGVSFDLEPAFEYAETLRRAPPFRIDRWVELLRGHVNPERFVRARDVLAGAVDDLHRAGLYAHAVALPVVLDEPDGSTIMEDALDTPVSGIDWDEVSFMVYQTAFAQLVGEWLGPALVSSYAADAVARFGARAGLDLGVVGNAGIGIDPGQRYPDPAALRRDTAAAFAAGIENLRVYSLDGVLEEGGVGRWLGLASTPAQPGGSRREVDGLRNGLAALARALSI